MQWQWAPKPRQPFSCALPHSSTPWSDHNTALSSKLLCAAGKLRRNVSLSSRLNLVYLCGVLFSVSLWRSILFVSSLDLGVCSLCHPVCALLKHGLKPFGREPTLLQLSFPFCQPNAKPPHPGQLRTEADRCRLQTALCICRPCASRKGVSQVWTAGQARVVAIG